MTGDKARRAGVRGGVARPLGYAQRHVLLTLSTRGDSTCTDWAAWYPLRPDQARGAIRGLGKRGLVDATGFDGSARTYGLTAKGREVVDELTDDDGLTDEGESNG